MKLIENIDTSDIAEIEREIKEREKLFYQLGGALYRSIVYDEIYKLNKYLRKAKENA